MKKFTAIVVFSLLIVANQLLTGINGWNVVSPRRGFPNVEHDFQGTWGRSLRHRGMSSQYRREKVLRGSYGSDGPIKQTTAEQPSSRASYQDIDSLIPINVPIAYPNATIVEIDEGKSNYVDVLVKCGPIIKYCLLNSVGSQKCTLSCLLDPFLVSKHLVSMVDVVARSLCSPISSVYDSGVPKLQSSAGKVKSVSQFLTLLGIQNESYAQFSRSAPAALPMQLIKYGKSPILDSLKPVVATIWTSIAATPTFNAANSLFANPVCSKDLDLGDSARRIAEEFITNPFTVDITLGGWFLLSNIGQFKTNPLTAIVNSILNTFKLTVGVHCSLVQYAEMGMGCNCRNVTGYKGLPTEVNRRQPEGQDEICGTLPDVPYLDLHKILPGVFPKDTIPAQGYYDIEDTEFTGSGFETNLNEDIVNGI